MDDSVKEAKDKRDQAMSDMGPQHQRMKEDLAFSNPSDPQQWDHAIDRANDTSRVTIPFDRTNQYIRQVVNKGKKMRPQIKVAPVDEKADMRSATVLGGLIKHIEYQSRANFAYDWGLDCAARMGLGYARVTTEVVDAAKNWQELRIKRVIDPFSVVLYDWFEIDGSDASGGSICTPISRRLFEQRWPNATGKQSENGQNDDVDVVEDFCIEEVSKNIIVFSLDGMTTQELREDDFHAMRQRDNVNPTVVRTYKDVQKTTQWMIFSGDELLEDITEFPAPFVPIVPFTGLETWIDGKRSFCGLPRMLRSGQIAYNYERCAAIEKRGQSPKAPFIGSKRAIEGNETQWARANVGNDSTLIYNDIDQNGAPIEKPTRQMPAPTEPGHAEGAQQSIQDMDAAVGMSQYTLLQNQAQTSGRALRERDNQADNANFDFTDNASATIAQIGRICISAVPRIYDQKRQAKIMGDDGKIKSVTFDPRQQQASKKTAPKTYAINPNVGEYDVRTSSAPGYETQQEESAELLSGVINSAPQFAGALAPLVVKLTNMPDGEKAIRVMLAMLPPEVKAAYEQDDDEEENEPLPVAAQQQMTKMQQTIQALTQALHAADAKADEANLEREKIAADVKMNTDKITEQARQHDEKIMAQHNELESKTMNDHANFIISKMDELTKRLDAETNRLKLIEPVMNEQQIAAIVMQTVQGIMATPVAPQGA